MFIQKEETNQTNSQQAKQSKSATKPSLRRCTPRDGIRASLFSMLYLVEPHSCIQATLASSHPLPDEGEWLFTSPCYDTSNGGVGNNNTEQMQVCMHILKTAK